MPLSVDMKEKKRREINESYFLKERERDRGEREREEREKRKR